MAEYSDFDANYTDCDVFDEIKDLISYIDCTYISASRKEIKNLMKLDSMSMQQRYPEQVSVKCFWQLKIILQDILHGKGYSTHYLLSLVKILALSFENAVFNSPVNKLMPCMSYHLVDFVTCINSILEMRAFPIFVRGNAVDNSTGVRYFCNLFNCILKTPNFIQLVNQQPDVGILAKRSKFLMQRQIASVIFPMILSGVMDHVPSSIPLTTSPAALKLLVSPSSSDCGLCLDPISDDTDYAMLTSCSHVFCISCAEEWFTNNSCCPTCRVSKSYWLPRKLVQSYQRYREANPELLVIQEEIPIHLLQVLSPLLKVN